MSAARSTRLKLVAFAMLLLALGLGLFLIAATELLDLVRRWGAARLYFGSGLLAMPGIDVVAIVMAALFVRAARRGQAPVELMTGKLMPLLAVAAGSVVLAAIGGLFISDRLTAAGYTRCDELGYEGRLSSGDWVKNASACKGVE